MSIDQAPDGKRPAGMIPMMVADVAVDPLTGLPSLWLSDERGERRVAIHIGLGEVSAIAAGLGGVELERPLPHDLLKQVLGLADIQLLHVELADSGEVPGRWGGPPETDDDLSDAHTGYIVLRQRGGAECGSVPRGRRGLPWRCAWIGRSSWRWPPSLVERPRRGSSIAVLGPLLCTRPVCPADAGAYAACAAPPPVFAPAAQAAVERLTW